jgi:hypothetical protein
VSIFARRFAPAVAVAFDSADEDGVGRETLARRRGTMRLTERGVLVQAGAE